MTIEQRREMVRLAKLDNEEFVDADSLEVLLRLEQRLGEAIQAAEAAGEYRRIRSCGGQQRAAHPLLGEGVSTATYSAVEPDRAVATAFTFSPPLAASK